MVLKRWKPVETFLENMHLTSDRATLRTTANHWRQYYDDTYPIILLLYGNFCSCSPTSRTHQRLRFSTVRSDTRPASHFTIMLGTFGSTPFTRYHYFSILATMEIYTTFLTIGNTSPDLTFE